MSSQLPVRRSTRTKRPLANEAENAIRSKMLPARRASVMGSSAPTTEAGVMRATASSKAKIVEQSEKSLVPKTRPTSVMGEKEVAVPGKRKREALVDVTEVNKKKAILSKGKAKAVDASTITTTTTSIATTSTSTTASSRKALRPIAEAPTRRVFGVLTKGTAKPEDKVEILRTAGAARRALQVLRDDTLATDSEPGPKVFSPPEELESTTPAHETLVDEENVAAHLSKVEDEEEIPHDDLDINDWDDPTMCAEYANEIFDYMKSVEPRTLPKAGYMDIQPELTWEMREQVFDWLIQVHYRFRFREESLFLCYNLLDRVLDLRQHVSKAKLQLVAVSCFLIATKFEEGVTPSIHDMATLVGDAYTVEEIQKAERYVLQTVGWDLSYPGPMGFLRRGSKADFYDPHSRTIAKYLLEVGYFDYHLVGTPPSQLAAASLWLARLAMGREDWDNNLCFYTTYKEPELIPIANAMLNYVAQPSRFGALNAKYSHKALYKVSVRLQAWIKSRWGDEGVIDLEADLPQIKAEIVKAREEQE